MTTAEEEMEKARRHRRAFFVLVRGEGGGVKEKSLATIVAQGFRRVGQPGLEPGTFRL